MRKYLITTVALLLSLCIIGCTCVPTFDQVQSTESDIQTENESEAQVNETDIFDSGAIDSDNVESEESTTGSQYQTDTETPETESDLESGGMIEGESECEAHSFGIWTVVKLPSCTEEGRRERVCACGAVEYELFDKLEQRIPRALSCEWDNDGLMCCPCGDNEVSRVLVALDVTGEVVEYAKQNGYDLILSHHPLIYKGIKAFDDNGYVSAKLLSLAMAGISVMSFHTRLDAVEGGVNDKLAELLGLLNTEPLYCEGIPLGRVGELSSKMSAEEFASKVKSVLGAPFVLLSDAKIEVKKVAVVASYRW